MALLLHENGIKEYLAMGISDFDGLKMIELIGGYIQLSYRNSWGRRWILISEKDPPKSRAVNRSLPEFRGKVLLIEDSALG